jgi:DNA ligase-1
MRSYTSNEFNGLKVAADWIQDLESSDGRLHKEAVIEKALIAAKLGSSSAQCFLYNCYLAYNPYFVYGVRQVPETAGITDQANPWVEFWALLEGLRTRSITGHRARDQIEAMSRRFDTEQWNGLCRRVIIKDLRCGISEKTINKVCKKTDWAIPVFSCQLAQDSTEHPAKMKGRKRLEVKLDGVRVLAVCSASGVTLYSRNGKVFENFPQIAEALDANYKLLPVSTQATGSYVLDGEIVGESFQKLMKQAHRKGNAKTDNMVYHVFDILTLRAFEEGFHNAQQHKRLETLEKFRAVFDTTNCVRVMSGIEVDLDVSEGQNIMRRFANDAVAQGFEGIMIKDLDAPYECRRSSFWMKLKPVYDYDLKVVGVEEGTGRNAGKLGALICEGVDQEKHIRVNVGSGLTDLQRDDYWKNKDIIIGQTAVVLADAVTQNQDGTYSLRFPRFKTFRDDK